MTTKIIRVGPFIPRIANINPKIPEINGIVKLISRMDCGANPTRNDKNKKIIDKYVKIFLRK